MGNAANKLDELAKRGIVKPFSSPGGKEAWRGLILQRIPAHKVYVEPYAGSATIFFAKMERAEVEILADVNPEIVATYVFLRDGSDDDFTWLRDQDFRSSEHTFKSLLESEPETRREKVYRFKYLNLHSVRGAGDRYNGSRRARENHTGRNFLRSLEKFRKRLEGVQIYEDDALAVMKRFDGPDTFFYLDPPWKPVGVGKEWKNFDAAAFTDAAKAIKGKALISYQGDLDLPEPWKQVTIASALGGHAGTSEQTLAVNFEAPLAKRYMDGEGGTHSHGLSRDQSMTGSGVFNPETGEHEFKPGEPDGAHTHLFVVNGMLVATESDGSHAHALPSSDANTTAEDGEHTHRIASTEGVVETGAEASPHSHGLAVDHTQWDGGNHVHTLEMDGETLTSLTPGQFWALFESGNESEGESTPDTGEAPVAASKADDEEKRRKRPYQKSVELYPQNTEPAAGMVHQHFAGGDHWLALRFKFDDRAMGWRFATQRTQVATAFQEGVSKMTGPHGDRYSKALVGSQVLALKGAPAKGTAVALDRVDVEFGLQSPHRREYFLTKGKQFSGVLSLELHTDGKGRESWTASLAKAQLPSVLTAEAMLDGVMPPDGISAMPQTLEKMVPPALRFWEFRGEAARAARDALVKSDTITEVGLLGGEFRSIVTERFVEAYPEHENVTALKTATVPDDLERAKAIVAWAEKSDAPPLIIPPKLANECGPDDLVLKMRETSREFLIGWPDSAHARRSLAELGRPFVMKCASEPLVFVASRPLAKMGSIEFISTFDFDAEVAKVLDVPEESALAKKIAKLYDDLLTREVPIYLSKKDESNPTREEMFVYGIVLEPDTVDAQQDRYSADEIRKAAHGYMEFHRNRGDQHSTLVNDKVVILESHIERSPDFTMTDSTGKTRQVKQGTWLLGYGIRDAELWGMVKRGERTGFSIGGSAVRRPRQG